jgi:hypothetical protein
VTIDESGLLLKCDLSEGADAGVPGTGHGLELVEDMVRYNAVVEVLEVSAGKDVAVGQMEPVIIVVAEVIPSWSMVWTFLIHEEALAILNFSNWGQAEDNTYRWLGKETVIEMWMKSETGWITMRLVIYPQDMQRFTVYLHCQQLRMKEMCVEDGRELDSVALRIVADIYAMWQDG